MPVMDRIGSWIRRTHPNAPLARDPGIFTRNTNDPDMARLLAAMARKESEFGSTSGRLRNNAYGYGIHLGPSVNTAANWDEMQQRVMRALQGNLYKGSNLRRPSEIINRWAPPSENNTNLYNEQVSSWIREMGGDPNADVFDGRDGATGSPGSELQMGSDAANQSGAVPDAPPVAQRPQGLDSGTLIGSMLSRPKGTRISEIVIGAAVSQAMSGAPAVSQAEGVAVEAQQGQAPTGADAPPATGDNADVINAARRRIGTPYSWGGGTPSGPGEGFGRGAGIVGFDCSSLVQYAWAKAGVQLPRVTYDQIKFGRGVDNRNQGAWAPGDLLFPHTGHVLMYIGDGKAIHAPQTGGHVEIVPANSRNYIAVRRPKG